MESEPEMRFGSVVVKLTHYLGVKVSMDPVGIPCAEFPRDLLPLLRCPRDAGPLSIVTELRTGSIGIVEGRLCCSKCAAEYMIEDGIARLMEGPLSPEDEHEIRLRDAGHVRALSEPYVVPASGLRSKFNDLLEVPQHLAELAPLEGRKVLEFGCGDGRFTMLMAQMGARIIAVDFSINALRKLAGFLPSGIAPTAIQYVDRSSAKDLRRHVGLVQADACHFHIADRSFDRAFSTTPLDTRAQRMAMYRTIADALTDEGRYVCSFEHDDLNRRLLGLPVARRYWRGGVFIEHFDRTTLRREVNPYFSKVHIRPIQPFVPLVRRLPFACAVRVSLMVGATPFLRRLGILLLVRAELPFREPAEGAYRPGNSLFKGLYRRYMRMIGKDPLWTEDEPV